MKKYFNIDELPNSGVSAPAWLILLYHKEVSGFILYNPDEKKILKLCLWETTIHNDQFDILVEKTEKEVADSAPFSSVKVVNISGRDLKLPVSLFQSDFTLDWIELIAGKDPDMEYIKDESVNNAMVVIHSMEKVHYDLLNSKFDNTRFYSLFSSFDLAKTTHGNQMELIFFNRDIYLALYKEGQLQLLNSYQFQTPEDVLYVLLDICEKYRIDKDELNIIPEGFIVPESAIIRLLDQYFPHIHWPADTLKENQQIHKDIPKQTVQFLERILTCVS